MATPHLTSGELANMFCALFLINHPQRLPLDAPKMRQLAPFDLDNKCSRRMMALPNANSVFQIV